MNSQSYSAVALKRLHSASGVFPLGLFVLLHIAVNARILGPEGLIRFDQALDSFRKIPFLVVIEVVFIFIPLAFHAAYGFLLFFRQRSNVLDHLHEANLRYALQRVTGLAAIAFVAYHLFATRISAGLAQTQVDSFWMVRLMENPFKFWIYLAGSTSVLFYFANGFWIAAIVWGVTVSPQSQRLSRNFCLSLFVILFLTNALTLLSLRYYRVSPPPGLGPVLGFVRDHLFR